jgi:4-methyl-5(b-hydroxyethyl)-thiazole monophosphate biosynthesis
MPRVLVPLARGFEEIEAVTLVDVLRRGGVEVVVAGLEGAGLVEGSHGIAVAAPVAFEAVAEEPFDAVALPGGEPGATHLAADARLGRLLQRYHLEGRPLAAICAAPRVLAGHGLLRDRTATSHPSVEAQLRDAGARYSEARVVRDGHVLTSRGPGTALEFALATLELLGLTDRATELRRAMLVHPATP